MGYEGIQLPPANVAADTLTQRANELAHAVLALNEASMKAPEAGEAAEARARHGRQVKAAIFEVLGRARLTCNALAAAMALNSNHVRAGGKVDRYPVAADLVFHANTSLTTAYSIVTTLLNGVVEVLATQLDAVDARVARMSSTFDEIVKILEKATGLKVDSSPPAAPGKA